MDIRAPITGNVWKVLVEVGQQIDEDDEVVILESMKMEIPVESPDAGTVADVCVAEGDAVKEGQVLIRLG
jgi:acetyl-CoA carboxylase biotin carboxyl carrier protein